MELPATGRSVAAHEYEEPAQQRALHRPTEQAAAAAHAGTDFSTWDQADVIAFLEQRGEDYDDCGTDFDALCQRAAECEHNTGPAVKPSAQPGPGHTAQGGGANDDDDDDPLDAFMADNAAAEATAPPQRSAAAGAAAADALDEADRMADYIAAHASSKKAKPAPGSGAAAPRAAAADSDEEVYAVADALAQEGASGQRGPPERRDADPLPPVDHSTVSYAPFKRDFYDEHPELFILDDAEVAAARRQQQAHVTGRDAPKPVSDFAHCGLPKGLNDALAAHGFAKPTAIQAQVLPVRCSASSRLRASSV